MGCCASRALCASSSPITRNKKRILLIGIDNVGKTALLDTLCKKNNTSETSYIPTIGFNMETVKGRKYAFDIWDVGGSNKNRMIWRHYYAGNDAVMFMVDGTQRERLSEARMELKKLVADESLHNGVWLIISNKQDLPGCMHAEEIEQILELETLLANCPYKVIEMSVTKNIGVDSCLEWVEDQLRQN